MWPKATKLEKLGWTGNLVLICLFLYQSPHYYLFPKVWLEATVLHRYWPQPLSAIWMWTLLSLPYFTIFICILPLMFTPDAFCFSLFIEWTFRFLWTLCASLLYLTNPYSLFFPLSSSLLFPSLLPHRTVWSQEWTSSILAWWSLGQLRFPYHLMGLISLGFCPPGGMPTSSLEERILSMELSWLIPLVAFLWFTESLHFFLPQILCWIHNIRTHIFHLLF